MALALFGLSLLFFRSRRGVVLRAVSDDYTASWSVGISVERASAVVGDGGRGRRRRRLLWGSIQGVDWSLSLLLIKALTVAMLGGLDSIGGVLLAGLLLGILESVAPVYLDSWSAAAPAMLSPRS